MGLSGRFSGTSGPFWITKRYMKKHSEWGNVAQQKLNFFNSPHIQPKGAGTNPRGAAGIATSTADRWRMGKQRNLPGHGNCQKGETWRSRPKTKDFEGFWANAPIIEKSQSTMGPPKMGWWILNNIDDICAVRGTIILGHIPLKPIYIYQINII